MVRIRVTPENLQSLSEFIAGKNGILHSADTQFQSILNSLDWETRQKINIDAEINKARTQARTLAAQADELVRTLKVRAQAFEQADRQSAEQLGILSNSIQQLIIGISTGLNSLQDWLKKRWPFLPIAILPIITIPLLPKIPWPPKVKPMPIRPSLPKLPNTFDLIGWKKPIQPLPSMKINPDARFPNYSDGKYHEGVDIWPEPKDRTIPHPINTIGPGVVSKIGYDPDGYGNYVIIEHTKPDGTKIYSLYAHLKDPPFPPKLNVGQVVGTNDENSNIGIMGGEKTDPHKGKSTGLHLHLEVFEYDKSGVKNRLNPEWILLGIEDMYFIDPPSEPSIFTPGLPSI